MYIEIRVQWTIQKMGCKFKQRDKYVINSRINLMIKIMYTFHTIEYHTYMC